MEAELTRGPAVGQDLQGQACPCDVCLAEYATREELIHHLTSWIHLTSVAQRGAGIRSIFTVAASLLEVLGTWERCFACGGVGVDTLVAVQCCRCNGRGDQHISATGVPGVPYCGSSGGSNSRFVCLEHALDVHCRSCSTPLGIEAYLIDPEAGI